jgi:histidyl-tRNA synthetase
MSGTQPARGMRDFLPQDVRRRQYVIGVIADVYQRYGFEPLETPAVENIETLTGKYGEEGDKLIFKILKRGEGAQSGQADLALRYDLTVPLARVVAEYRATLPKFFKRYQVQPVWRADRPQKGRFREFYQCDVDAIGSASMLVEAELLSAAADVFARLGFTTFTIRVNHRQALAGILDAAGIPAALHGAALVGLDKLDKVGPDGVAKELAERGVSPAAAEAVLGLFTALDHADNSERLERVRAHVGDHEAGSKGASELDTLLRLTMDTSAASHIVIDPSLARGLSYYTGPVFEVVVPDLAGSLGGGGRYDDLIGMFLGQQVPATGISLGLERILVVMGERGMFPEGLTDSAADVMVLAWPEQVGHALKLAATLRAESLRVEVYPDAQDKIDKKIKYAAGRGVRCVAIVGEAEAASDTVVMRNMTTREQSTVARDKAAALVKSLRPA